MTERVEWGEMSANVESLIEAKLGHMGVEVLLTTTPTQAGFTGVVLWVTRTSTVAKASKDGLEYGVHNFNPADGTCYRGTYTTSAIQAKQEYAKRATGLVTETLASVSHA